MPPSMLRTAAILGLLATVGPFAVDMYLPALPAIADDLQASPAATQATLVALFISFGAAQLVYGPWSDMAGRKQPLYAGLAVFTLGTVGCIFAPTIEWLIASRFLQGAGGAVSMVITRAVVRDLYTGADATRMMATVMLVISVSPMLAPLGGSLLILVFDWRAIFVVLCLAAVASLTLTRFGLKETLAPEHRRPANVGSLIAGCRVLFRDVNFLGLTFIGGFGFTSFIVFIASGSFVYTGQFGLSPMGFSLAFAVNALGFFAASQFAAGVCDRFGMQRTVLAAVIGFAATTTSLWVLTLAGHASLPLYIGFLFASNACLGFVIPTTMVMALDDHGDLAGLASSLGGTLQMVAGGVAVAIAGRFFDGTALPMITAIALSGISALVIALVVLVRRRQAAPV